MIARLLIASSINTLKEELSKTLVLYLKDGSINHPDLLFIHAGEKLGIAEAKKIKEFFSLKPFSAKGRVAILEDASTLTHEAQNALLKTIEELPQEAVLIMGSQSDANLLPTVLSRCEIINLEDKSHDLLKNGYQYLADVDKLLNASIAERFEYVEKLKEKEEFLRVLTHFFRQQLLTATHPGPHLTWLNELLQAEKWTKQNVNTRAILEYLMLIMPKLESNR